jgi:hypothetical protein
VFLCYVVVVVVVMLTYAHIKTYSLFVLLEL